MEASGAGAGLGGTVTTARLGAQPAALGVTAGVTLACRRTIDLGDVSIFPAGPAAAVWGRRHTQRGGQLRQRGRWLVVRAAQGDPLYVVARGVVRGHTV